MKVLQCQLFPKICVGLLYIEGFPAMLPINYVHLLPAIYYICSPCAAARFRNNCFDWILEEFSWWVLLVASLDNFLLSAEIVRASLLECIGRCASLHIWCHAGPCQYCLSLLKEKYGLHNQRNILQSQRNTCYWIIAKCRASMQLFFQVKDYLILLERCYKIQKQYQNSTWLLSE